MLTIRKQNEIRPLFPDFFNEIFKDDYFFENRINKNESIIPALNIREDDKEIAMELVVPGFKKEDIKISLDKDVLTIYSEIKEESKEEDKEKNFLRKEFYYNSFKREIIIPEDKIDSNKIVAKYEGGILKLHIPKREEAINPARLIDIQ